MLEPKSLLDGLGAQLNKLYDDSRAAGSELEGRLKALLQGAVERMDLVSREAFDRQTLVLEHTRAKVEELERRLAELQPEPPQAQPPEDTSPSEG